MLEPEWEIIRRRVVLAGRITNKNNMPLCGIPVRITSASKKIQQRLTVAAEASEVLGILDKCFDRTRSRQDGFFYFMDLPSGKYTVSVYPSDQKKAERKKIFIDIDNKNVFDVNLSWIEFIII